MTNGDKIRSMSDEEMAIEISKLSSVIDGVHGVKGVSS